TVGIVLGVNRTRTNVILGDSYRTLWGSDRLEDTLCGLSFRLSVPSFYQINHSQCEVLYSKAVEFAGLTGQETVLDLYCGVGTITLTMAAHARRVLGAEIVPEAIADAKDNAARNGIENAEFFCGDAGAVAAKLAAEHLRPDVVTVDPPRKGLAEDVVRTIAQMAPERVVYVSCDPATLARDVARFAAEGYCAVRAVAVDMFPRADHVETVCLLSKLSEAKHHISVQVDMEELDVTAAESKATYEEIQEWVQEKYGFHVSHLNIAKTKRKCGIIERQNYNLPKSEDSRSPETPKEKEEAIVAAFKAFQMI
ncbi:MAG: 23S rRNA (uracil(1939)-C(5))-methyltransferase RlmD, partial [Acidaminococcaceae bacterium]|nr:23S rRNA (uracil(1939)-C(5))-methyltransferase RlmD [Acidaminococcaceae bacterium]